MGNRLGPLAGLRSTIGRHLRIRRRKRGLPVIDFIGDIEQRLPGFDIHVIYDVGAHIGMTAIEFSDAWPDATIHAFEPSARNRERMAANLVGKPDIKRVPIGMSNVSSNSELLFDAEHPSMSRLTEGGYGERELVELRTIDAYSIEQGIEEVDILKIDVEGHELKVLEGARKMLALGNIGVIRIECAVDPDTNYHIQLLDLTEVLHPLGYRLFGIYEQSEDALSPGPKLRRFDAAFISPRLVATKTAGFRIAA